MLYLVLGCGPGSMGEAVAAGLLKFDDARVFLTDLDPENEVKTLEKLRALTCGAKSEAIRPNELRCGFNVLERKNELPKIFGNMDIVISALPAHLNPTIAEAVLLANESRPSHLKWKTHYCDLGGVLDITKKIASPRFSRRAKALGISLVPECGFQPGSGNIHVVDMYLKYFGEDMHWKAIDSITSYVGGLPKTPPNYKPLFNLQGLEEIYYNSPLTVSNGKVRKIKRLSHYEAFPSSRFGFYFGEKEGCQMEAAVTGGLGILPYFMAGRVKTLQEKTLRYQGHYELIKKTPRENFKETMRNYFLKNPCGKEDFCLLHIEAIGFSEAYGKKIKAARTIFVASDENFTSMQKATGFSTAVVAKMIADGKAKTGCYPPEIALCAEEAISEFNRDLTIVQEFVTPLK